MEQNMGKKVIISRVNKVVWSILNYGLITLIYFGLLLIYLLHHIVPFFPVLFLFDFCFVVGYPLFLRYVLKRKWFECTKDNYLELKYISIPWLIMELVVLLYYNKAAYFIITTIIKNSN